MNGNVWEWCSDRYDENYYESSPVFNPQGPSSGTSRVLRGGSWYDDDDLRSADRDWIYLGYRDFSLGFRIVVLPEE